MGPGFPPSPFVEILFGDYTIFKKNLRVWALISFLCISMPMHGMLDRAGINCLRVL